jgi:shikimate kinase
MMKETQETLKKHGIIIYLAVSLAYQHTRTINETRRPLLRVENRGEIIEKLHAEQVPIYEALADYRILTDNRSVQAVAEDIMHFLHIFKDKR